MVAALSLLASACTSGSSTTPTRVNGSSGSASGDRVTDWRVGAAGGAIASADGTVRVQIPKDGATEGSTVRIHQTSLSDVTGLVPVADFDISAVTGSLKRGSVTVRYDASALQKAGSDPDSLMMLIQDKDQKWQALDHLQLDSKSRTVTATWPHFSRGIIGGFKSAGKWWVDHVLTYGLGPKKTPDCDKKDGNWKKDRGWSFRTTNAAGGGMKVAPLDGCAAVAHPPGRHHVEITNRYWYAFQAPIPTVAHVEVADILKHTQLEDVIIAGALYYTSNSLLIPGHSRAHVSIDQQPKGQTVRFNATADTASVVLAMAVSVIDLASFGTGKAVRAALRAGEDALWAERAALGTPTIADIAVLVADPAWRARAIAKHATKQEPGLVNRIFDSMEAVNCVYSVVHDTWPNTNLAKVADILGAMKAVGEKCRKALALAALGWLHEKADPKTREKLVLGLVKGLLDIKPQMTTMQASMGGWANLVGKDYSHAILTATQARDPRYNSFAPLGKNAHPTVPGIEPVNEVGYLNAVTARPDGTAQITVDRVTWEWCRSCVNDYRVTNDSTVVRTYLLKRDALIRLLNASGYAAWNTVTVNGLAAHVRKHGRVLVVLRHAADDSVTGIGEPWRP